MATTAKSTKSAKSTKKKKTAAARAASFPYELAIGLFAVFFTLFFTRGLPFFGDDLSLWLPRAQSGWFAVFAHFHRPWTVALYKLFPHEGVLFFLKALGVGGLAALLFRVLETLKVKTLPALLALGLFCTSINVLAAEMRLSDMAPLSELILLATLFWAWRRIESGEPIEGRDKKIFSAIFFSSVYFGSGLQGDVCLAPLVLAAYLAVYRRRRLREFAPLLAGTFLASLPWAEIFRHFPSWSLGRALGFLIGADFFSLRPLSLAAGLVWLVVPALGYAGLRYSSGKLPPPKKEWAFLLSWLGVAVVASGFVGFEREAATLQGGFAAWVPATLLLGLVLDRAFKDFAKKPVIQHTLLGLIAVQCLTGIAREYNQRASAGRAMIAESQARRLARHSGRDVFVSWSSSLDPRVRLERTASGCTTDLFDWLFPCPAGEGALLLKTVGAPPELARAEDLDRRGEFEEARSVAYSAWAKNRKNHGAGFVAAQYAQRAGDYAKMERIYDEIGPYFPETATVLYNWGLAKEGVGKYSESSRLMQKAYALTHDATVGYELARLYHHQGKRGRALATVGQLLQLYPESSRMKDTYQYWSTH